MSKRQIAAVVRWVRRFYASHDPALIHGRVVHVISPSRWDLLTKDEHRLLL